MAYFSRPEELLRTFLELFDANKGLLGLRYVATQEENLISEYPAIDCAMGASTREFHGTQRFLVTWNASFWIYHANFEGTHRRRSIEEMNLCTNVVQFLHLPEQRDLRDETGSERIIMGSGYITNEIPGVTTRNTGQRVLTTRLVWTGQSIVNFGDS